MNSFEIKGPVRLSGEIIPQGAKNEALQIICAVLLTAEKVSITNIPDIRDVNKLIELLQSIGVKLTENEYLGIKLHDGLYKESNKEYLMASSDFELKCNLPYIIHQAALMAVRAGKNLYEKK